jgi:monoamine oxidase
MGMVTRTGMVTTITTTTSSVAGIAMADDDVDVAVIGGGAAGLTAARRLHDAGIRCLVIEARARLGGRAWTVTDASGYALDLGCGWLHSADRNPWSTIAQAQGLRIDRTPPPWTRPSLKIGFSMTEQLDYFKASHAFYERLDAAERAPDRPASELLDPGGRWNNLIIATNTFVSGAELDRISAHDIVRYDDTGVNWRVIEGYGAAIAGHGAGLPVALDCAVLRVDHSGLRVRIETAKGTINADQVIVTLPTPILAQEELFAPALPDKVAAARGLPLGLDDKLFLSLEEADEFEKDSRVFGRTDRAGTGSYHLRPFGRPQIEGYFGGRLASDLEAGGPAAFFDFAVAELTGLFGSAFARRLKLIHMHCWGTDPYSRGSYSYAQPDKADNRAALATAIDDRLFFAGEACSLHHYSTAHGGWFTGVDAADQVRAARQKRPS